MVGFYIMENPIKMDDLGVPPFMETSIYCKFQIEIPCSNIFKACTEPEPHKVRTRNFRIFRDEVRGGT